MQIVAVVAGGPSREHEISRASGEQVLAALDRSRYRPLPVFLRRDGSWDVDGTVHPGPLQGTAALLERGCACAFLALHGPFGEDGTLQALCETAGLPHTGSGVLGSALAQDKIRAKRLVAARGCDVAPDCTVPPAGAEAVKRDLGFPVFVKNPYEGSTLGLLIAESDEDFAAAVEALAPTCDRLLVERWERGRELTAGILEDLEGRPQALPLLEILPKSSHFDFESKYSEGGARKRVPTDLSPSLTARIRETALAIHETLGLSGMSRSDFILRGDGTFVFLETNSIPGLTPTSLLPKAAAEAGIPFPDVLTRLVEAGMRRGVPARG